jgi:integrase
MFAGHPVTSLARRFFARVGTEGWERMPLEAQCALPLKERRVVGWLMVTGRIRPAADYLVACRPYLGEIAAHHHRAFHERFSVTSAELGFDRIVTRLQWYALAKVAALAGVVPEQLTKALIEDGQQALAAAIGRHRPDSHGVKALTAALFGAQTTLFHLGILDAPPRKSTRDRSAERANAWASVPSRLASTLQGYIAQVRWSLRPSTMVRVEGVLREFACGMRKGEFLDLIVDSVVQIGAAYWLHVPLGKLRSDRYIPLHPQLKELLDDWLANQSDSLRTPFLFVEHGQRIRQNRVDRAVAKAAQAAGIGHVNPHRLRHTLATQAINRGMSLEAIAALLGHRSMRMTMVYARIANRTVADEYFTVSEKVEALYDAPRELPADAEGAEMRKLRAEMHQRMLGNGYCARPVGLDCHFESICESCTFFQTTIEFRPTLQRQRDDAAAKGQIGRQKIFDGLLTRLDADAS